MTISTTEERQFVVFDLGNESFGIDIAVVKEIIQKTDSTKLPEMDEFIDGIINVRGDVIPIISLGRKFKLYDSVTEDQETKVIIVELEGTLVGLAVDSVEEVLRIPATSIQRPTAIAGINLRYIQGIAQHDDRLLILLDVNEVFSINEKEVLMEATSSFPE
ncbi:MAG: chemotaxis protein CheW [Firmicutes bacterium]|nr:chemotaxis protein CheW [Bacillota bacterium]